ncbi:MAG: glycosyltransferase family 4 protein [Steroidobacteraceae bacterium]
MRRVYFVGLRGFPRVQGGIETHVENLVLQLSKHDAVISCFGRKRYRRERRNGSNLRWIWLWAPKGQGIETLVHTLLCVICLSFMRRGIVHLHGIGPGAFAPFLRLLGFRVIVTHHGYDYARAKWGLIASSVLKAGELLSVRFPHEVISVSKHVAEELSARFNRQIHYVPNGLPCIDASAQANEASGGEGYRPFFLMASRLVPEKRIQDAINAFLKLNANCAELLIAGSPEDPKAEYSAFLHQAVPAQSNISFLGSVSHEVLWRLMSKCCAFVNASSHEGLPISVLEAAAQRAPLILSDIPAHREFALPDGAYYAVGDAFALTQRMRKILAADEEIASWRIDHEKMKEYSWKRISDATMVIYGWK